MSNDSYVELTASIVSAFVSKNHIPVAGIPDIIKSVHGAIADLAAPRPTPEAAAPIPAVNPKKSVFDDHIICLDDGMKFKSLKRHIATLGMTPDQYREKWSLPSDYPMVAPSYAARRSELAKAMGLGRKA